MSQLRQPGDYLKNNRTGAAPPCIHMLTAESNQKVENKLFQEKQLSLNYERENSLRQQPREFRPRHRQLYTVHKREQTYKNTLRKGCQQRTTQEFRQELWHNG